MVEIKITCDKCGKEEVVDLSATPLAYKDVMSILPRGWYYPARESFCSECMVEYLREQFSDID